MRRDWAVQGSGKSVNLCPSNIADVAEESPRQIFVTTNTGGKYRLAATYAEFMAWLNAEPGQSPRRTI